MRLAALTSRPIERVLFYSGLLLLGMSSWNVLKFTAFQMHPEWFGTLSQLILRWQDGRGSSCETSRKLRLPPVLIGTLEIPRIDMSVLVVDGDSEESLSVGAGHVPGTALPGERGNSAIAGHRDTAFRALRNVRIGDRVWIENGHTYNYVVTSVKIVDSDDIGVLQDTGAAMLTMITCYPFRYIGAAPKRYVVRARMI